MWLPRWRRVAKNLPTNAGDAGSIPGWGRSPGEGNGNLLQYFCWEIPSTEEPGRLQFLPSQRAGQDLMTKSTTVAEPGFEPRQFEFSLLADSLHYFPEWEINQLLTTSPVVLSIVNHWGVLAVPGHAVLEGLLIRKAHTHFQSPACWCGAVHLSAWTAHREEHSLYV